MADERIHEPAASVSVPIAPVPVVDIDVPFRSSIHTPDITRRTKPAFRHRLWQVNVDDADGRASAIVATNVIQRCRS
jgi:hypothetical protein